MDWRTNRNHKSIILAAGIIATVLLAAIPSTFADVFSATTITTSPKKPLPLPSTSVVFRVQGNVYPLGIYYASIYIGNPPKLYFMDIDTGSDVSWLQCDAPCRSCSKSPHPLYLPTKDRLVQCENTLCKAVYESTQPEETCESPDDQCHYEIQYQDNGNSLGVLVTDNFVLKFTNKTTALKSLAFGCGYDQQNWPPSTDGMLGLGIGVASFPSQLRSLGVCRNIVGHCLRRNSDSLLFIGDYVASSHGLTWVPMSTISAKYYSPGLANVFAGNMKLADKQVLVFDSGSSYTYFTNQLYQSLLSTISSAITKTPLKAAREEKALPLCWKDKKPFNSVFDLSKYFPSITLNFASGKSVAQMVIPPENYFIVTEKGNACLGILNGSDIGLKDFSLIGDISMQDMMVVYDNENQRFGWAVGCDRLLMSGNSPP